MEGATSLTLVHTAATNYLPQFPDYKDRDYKALNRKTLSSVEGMTKEQLLQEHQTDYQALFNRVTLHSEWISLPSPWQKGIYNEWWINGY